METSVIFGGAGFLGSHLCRRLLEEDHHVVCVDNFSSGVKSNVGPLITEDKFELVEHDVRDGIPLETDADFVYHLASRASPADFRNHAIEIAMSNSAGTNNVFEFARAADARVLLASTSEIYGQPEAHPQTESYNGNVDPRSVRAVYDESKRLSEALAVAYGREYELDVRTTRIFNTYGPRMRRDDGRAVPNFVTQALSGKELTVHGDGSQTRSFMYVDDLIEGFLAYMVAPDLSGKVINLGNTNEITILKLAETVLDVVDTDSEIRHVERPSGDPDCRQPDIERASRLLDWTPDVSLREGIRQTATYFANHE